MKYFTRGKWYVSLLPRIARKGKKAQSAERSQGLKDSCIGGPFETKAQAEADEKKRLASSPIQKGSLQVWQYR
jgi:hypothetical protein